VTCYVCNQQGRETSAVAICIVCGMALCPEHLIREELPVFERISMGMGMQSIKMPETLPRIVCAECHHALHQK
jgi:hypothetical protein